MLSMTNTSRRKAIPAIAVVAALVVAVSVALAGCTESARVSYNIKQDADNFNVARRLTVFNMRSDKVLMQMTGCFALHNDTDNELEVVCELPDGSYQKHLVYLNDWTMYTVEQLDTSDVDRFNYELNFLPQELPGVKITSKDEADGRQGRALRDRAGAAEHVVRQPGQRDPSKGAGEDHQRRGHELAGRAEAPGEAHRAATHRRKHLRRIPHIQ